MKSPTVGTSHSTPSTTSTMFTGALAMNRRIFAATPSCGFGTMTAVEAAGGSDHG